ncbi:hypothetical protein WUBG_00511 [Wuchereria bancrofti]|uniref:Uncharacterized protein n=1 Tax=Wuchereria bancrofti TaxID=6293 RepID=J9BM41_WUCBA|nr:hypothetical protein WUBG_00511 [Wuchereria bancrofti]
MIPSIKQMSSRPYLARRNSTFIFKPNLKDEAQSQQSCNCYTSHLINSSSEALRQLIRNSIQQSRAKCVGFSSKKSKDWFSENDLQIQELLSMKRAAHHRAAELSGPDVSLKKAILY